MKMKTKSLSILFFALTALCLVSCKKEKITISPTELWFPTEASVQEIQVTANCSWTISIDDDADWYTIQNISDANNIMSGRGSATISVTTKSLEEYGQRSSSFTITSAKGNVQIQVRVMQNTDDPAELKSITNLVFGVANITHWNVDFYGEVIEETYHQYEFNPYDTATGYTMFFFPDSIGIQKACYKDSTVYYQFKYAYNPDTRIIHFNFVTVNDTAEIYNAPVLVATEELFRFQHEYKPMRWEIADMRRIGIIKPHEKSRIMQVPIQKRKNIGGVFQF